jgi:hypothetical protein
VPSSLSLCYQTACAVRPGTRSRQAEGARRPLTGSKVDQDSPLQPCRGGGLSRLSASCPQAALEEHRMRVEQRRDTPTGPAPVAGLRSSGAKDLQLLLLVTMLEGRAARRRAYAQRRTHVEHIAGCHDDHSRTTMNVVANGRLVSSRGQRQCRINTVSAPPAARTGRRVTIAVLSAVAWYVARR